MSISSYCSVYRHRLTAGFAALILTLTLTGCTKDHADSSAPAPSAVPPATTAEPTEAPTTAPPPGMLNTLTGNTDLQQGAPTRPFAIMLANDAKARPQYGIDKADLFVEVETEGGITRIMAVFANVNRTPDKLAPVRSARTPFVLMAQSLDAIYAHFGGSQPALSNIKSRKMDSINGLYYDGTTYWRDATLRKTKGLDHSAMTGRAKLTKHIQNKKFRTTSSRPSPYRFDGPQGQQAATNLQVTFSGAQTVAFQYDTASGLYQKFNGTLAKKTPHVASDNTPLTVSNVLVMYDEKYDETPDAAGKHTYSFTLKSGSGLAVSGGVCQTMKWTRTDTSLSFTDESGQPLSVSKGKTYICLVNRDNRSATIVR